jgi:hypothetical protein
MAEASGRLLKQAGMAATICFEICATGRGNRNL